MSVFVTMPLLLAFFFFDEEHKQLMKWYIHDVYVILNAWHQHVVVDEHQQ
jgi:hypothetical protein